MIQKKKGFDLLEIIRIGIIITVLVLSALAINQSEQKTAALKAVNIMLPVSNWSCSQYNQIRIINETLFDDGNCRLADARAVAQAVGIETGMISDTAKAIICPNGGDIQGMIIWKNGTICTQYAMIDAWQVDDVHGTTFAGEQ